MSSSFRGLIPASGLNELYLKCGYLPDTFATDGAKTLVAYSKRYVLGGQKQARKTVENLEGLANTAAIAVGRVQE